MTPEQRAARQTAVMNAAKSFAAGESDLAPLNPEFDRQFLEIVDSGHLGDLDTWSNSFIANEGGNSAHEIRTWVAAFAALAAAGPYRTDVRYYRPAPELIAAFAGYTPPPDDVVDYLRRITDGLVSEARIRQYVDSAPEMMEFLEKLSPWFEFVWKPGYADYYPELPGGSELGSTINVPPIDLRTLADEEQHLLAPLALAPRGIWLGPKELRSFYQVRQSWAGKGVLVKLVWRMVRARIFGDRRAAIGQSLAC